MEASKTEIELSNTALGRALARKKKELQQSALTMADDEWELIVSARRSALISSLDDTTFDEKEDDDINPSLDTIADGEVRDV